MVTDYTPRHGKESEALRFQTLSIGRVMIGFVIIFIAIVVILAILHSQAGRRRLVHMQPAPGPPKSKPQPIIPAVVNRDALTALRERTPMPYERFCALTEVEKRHAFSFEWATTAEAALALRCVVERAVTGEVSSDDKSFWIKANEALKSFGAELDLEQSHTVLHGALSTAFTDGQRRRLAAPEIRDEYPYLGVDTAHDINVRPNHFALDYRHSKAVFLIDDVLWTRMRPPFGRDCRCSLRSFSKKEVQQQGLSVGRGEDWYGKEVEVEMPVLGQLIRTRVLPDSELVKLDSSFAKFLQTRRPESVCDVFWREYPRSRKPKLAQKMEAYAQDIIQQAFKCQKEDKHAHAYGLRILGELAEFSGDIGKAIEYYEKAVSLNPQVGIKQKLARLRRAR